MNPTHAVDDVYAFFLHCYHLKDWLKRDPFFTHATDEAIESFVTETPALALCADVANATKHFMLDRQPRSGRTPGALSGTVETRWTETFAFDGEVVAFQIAHLYLDHGGRPVAIAAVARDAVAAWRRFLAPAKP